MVKINIQKAEECREFCRASLLQTSQPYREIIVPPDTLLYHYTDSQGLLGIIQNNAFWATEALFLSDPVELHHSTDLITKAIEQYSVENIFELSEKQLDEIMMLPTTTKYNMNFRERVGFDTYIDRPENASAIISFSTNNDSLLLWREYADKGNGYALAFNNSDLIEQITSGTPIRGLGFWGKVLYQDEKKVNIINDIILTYLKYFKDNDINFDTLFNVLNQELHFLLPLLKSTEYSQENEVRYFTPMSNLLNWSLPLVDSFNLADIHFRNIPHGIFPDEIIEILRQYTYDIPKTKPMDVVFSSRNGVIIPRIRMTPIDGGRLPIREIVIGPSLNQDLAEIGVRRLCDRYYLPSSIRIMRSKVKYRSHL